MKYTIFLANKVHLIPITETVTVSVIKISLSKFTAPRKCIRVCL